MFVAKSLESNRLSLTPPALSDARDILNNWANDPEVVHYLPWEPYTSLSQADQYVARALEAWEQESAARWVIRRNADKKLIGSASLEFTACRAELFYVFSRSCWGEGYATEAAKAVVEAAFSLPHIQRVWAYCDVENKASAKVLENIGMSQEAVLKNWLVHPALGENARDCLSYAICR